MTSSVPKFVLDLIEAKSQISFQRSKVLPIHSYSKKDTPVATPKSTETFPYMMVRGASSETRTSQTPRRAPSEHRYKKLLYTMADQRDLKTSESTALMTIGDYRMETSPQMLTPTSNSQRSPSSTRKNITSLRKSNFSISDNKVFGSPKFMPTSILTDRPSNIKPDLLSALTKKSVKIFQRGGGGDALLLGTSPRKPVKKISNNPIEQ